MRRPMGAASRDVATFVSFFSAKAVDIAAFSLVNKVWLRTGVAMMNEVAAMTECQQV